MTVSEEGVNFESPHTKEMMVLTPEHSIEIQQALGADIMMQLGRDLCPLFEFNV